MEEIKIELFRNWGENLEDNLNKLSELNYNDIYHYQKEIYDLINFDSEKMSDEELIVKYGIEKYDINRIKSITNNINQDGKMKGQKWNVIDENKIKEWLINPQCKTFEELCYELERSGVAIEARIQYLLEKELFFYTGDIGEFCKKYHINMLLYHLIMNRNVKVEKKKIQNIDNENKEKNVDEEVKKEEVITTNFLQPKWTADEEKFLKVLLKNGKSIKEIMTLLKRSKDDIEQRTRIFVYREFEDQISVWSKNYKMTSSKVISSCMYQIKKMSESKKIEIEVQKNENNDVDNEEDNNDDIMEENIGKKSLFS